MAGAQKTRDHETIRRWADERGGHPAFVTGTGGLLRIDFEDGDEDERLEEVTWEDFFAKFDEAGVDFLYSEEEESRFNKFVDAA